MPALDTVADYIAECRRLLQDEDTPPRYPDSDIVENLNMALLEARRLRADLFLPMGFEQPFYDASGAIDLTAKVNFEPMYRPSLIYYIVGRTQLRDDEETTDQRASALMNKFLGQMLTIAS